MNAACAQNELHFQRGLVHGLMRKRELPTDRVTVMHRDLFGRNGIPWKDGMSMDALLASLGYEQLRALVHELRDDEEVDDE